MKVAQEQHGDGPIHFSISLADGVVEIYLTKTPSKITFGLFVDDVALFRAAWLVAGGKIGKFDDALLDPDGNVLIASKLPNKTFGKTC